MTKYNDGLGSSYIFSYFYSYDHFNNTFTATVVKSPAGAQNFSTIDVTVKFTPDSVEITGEN